MSLDLRPSASLRRAANAERERIDRARQKLLERRERLRQELGRIDEQLEALEVRDGLLDQLAGSHGEERRPRGVPAAADAALGGRELRETAARILYLTEGPDCEVHYRAWLTHLVEAGYRVAGRDPGASFLTNVSRSPVVSRGQAPGTYRIDLARVDAMRAELAEKQAELGDLVSVIARERDLGAGARLRHHRTKLIAEVRRLEGQLAEAERVTAPAERGGDVRILPRAAA